MSREETIAFIDVWTELEGGEEPDECATEGHEQQGGGLAASTGGRFQTPTLRRCSTRTPSKPVSSDKR
jgi:hypothetical protein